MSADRPPSEDSIEGDVTRTSITKTPITLINSKNAVTTTSTTTTTAAANMVLSAIPLDSGHVVIQQSATGSRIATLTNTTSTTHLQQIQHHHQQLQQHIQKQNNTNGLITTGNFTQQQLNRNNISPSKMLTTTTTSGGGGSGHHHSITKIIGTTNGNGNVNGNQSTATPSKYVIFQPNGHYTTNDAFINQSNGVGNIVIVATEPMDISHPENQHNHHHQQITAATNTTTILNTNNGNTGIGTTDEELTSLTWLTDKNLIKGLVACNTNKISGTGGATVQNIGNSPGRQINCINNGGNVTPLSPTSDFMDDSCVSDENLSSANSSTTTDQGICVRQNVTNDYSTAIHLHKSQQQQQQQQQQQHHIQYINNNKNNNTISKNRNNIISPTKNTITNFTTNNNNNNLIQQLQEHQTHNLNGNLAAALGATTTVHVGPSGTTTVVEYKSTNQQNYLQSSVVPVQTVTPTNNRQQQVPSHSIIINSSTSNLTSTISPITQQQQQQQNNKTLNNSFNPVIITSSTIPKSSQNLLTSTTVSPVPLVVSTVTTIPTPIATTTTTTHHPHKKYLREQMNGFVVDQQQNVNNNVNNGALTNTLNGQYSPMSSANNLFSGNGTGVNSITSTKTNNNNSSMLTIAESPPRDYQQQQQQHHSTPNKYAEYDNDSLKDFEIPNGTLSSSSSSSNGRISSTGAQKPHNNTSSSGSLSPSKQKHPTNMPYDPYVHTNSKPPYSFSSLIFMAIEDSPEKALPVKEIYAWIVHHFPYFKTAPTGWKNSVRHNLSLNKSFLKVEKAPNMGKGSLWRVEQLQRPNLIQALARSPFHPCSAIDKHLQQQHKTNQVTNSVKYTSSGIDSPPMTPVKSNLDARLFPKLSKMIREIIDSSSSTAATQENLGLLDNDGTINFNNNNANILNKNNINNNTDYFLTNNKNNCINSNTDQNYENVERLARDCGADSIDDVNAATAMLALKHGPKVFTETFNNGSPVITNSPSEDHTYSAGGGSSINGGSVNNIVIVGSSGICSSNSSVTGQIGSQNGSDNVSNGISSDAAYESSEESHNITAAELEEQRRVEGVDALLSLSSMFDISATPLPSPIKRPSSSIIEEEHISSYMENIPHLNGKGILAANSTIDEGYNTPASYYSHLMSNTNISAGSLSSGSLPKKLKQSRGIRAKIKRKTAWIR